MDALIVYANPEPTSFCAALKDVGARALRAAGYGVEISDLYGESFNPVAGRHDFTTVADAERFHYQTEQGFAFAHDGYAADLKREQARFKKADLLVVHFPLWWGGMPAILKGWFDRVLAYGFAYVDGKRYEQGYFRGRRGILCVTTGGTPERFSPGGVYGPISQVLYPVDRCMIEYLGLQSLDPFVAYAAPRVDDAARKDYLRAWEARLRAIVAQPALARA
ncbi:MAG TPA: NAD(P)H-dependent oxidoreductase [Xanthobacteraceae bacterium]|nr:NAD(P)H-dependent oxidoreductase [Xanthobacteraceae bacterium]